MRYALLMSCIFLTGAVFAQSDLSVLHYFTTKDGLSNNEVGCTRKDSRGFIWIATKEGLNRFDGFHFKKYFSERNNPGSLTHNNIWDILEYKPGQLLIATGNGLSVLNTLTGKFENEKIAFDGLKPALGNTINSLYKDKQHNIWVNHNGELDILDSNLHYLYRFTDLPWATHCKGALIGYEDWQTDKNNRIWFLSDTSGINIIDQAQKKVFNAKFNPEQLPYLQHDYIRSFLVDEQNNAIWYAPWGRGLFRYDLLKKTLQQIFFGMPVYEEARTINAIVKTEAGNILCFIAGKCYEINSVTAQYKELLLPYPGNQHGVGGTTILKTNAHQYWVGGTGVWLLDKKKDPYIEIPVVNPGKPNTGESTDLFISPSGKLYCTYKNNLLLVIEKDRNIFSYYSMQNKPSTVFTTVTGDGKHVWVGSTTGLFLFNEKNKTFIQPTSLPTELRYYNINILYTDNDGGLWIGSRNPLVLYHYTSQNDKFEKVDDKIISHFAQVGFNGRISNIVSDRSGNLWMTSRLGGGIVCYEKKSNVWRTYPPAGKNYEFLQKKGLVGLHADDSGLLWFSNYIGDGLISYDYKKDSVTKFSRSDGLQSDYIQNIFGDKTGRLWLTTGYGITSLNTNPFRAESSISIPGGNVQVDPTGILDDVGNSIVLALPDRLLFIPTGADTINKPLPAPVLDKVTVNNQQLFFDPQNEKLVLHHEQKNITIDFTAVSFLHEDIRFAYQLSGVDKDWKYADITRSAQYSVLAPGSYTFIMKSGNEKGDWSQPYELLSFTIHPPWWQTVWFRILAVALIIAGIYLLMKIRIRQIKKEAGLKHKIVETEMMALRAQMNPHFIFNCINSIDAMIQSNDKYNATVYLNKFARLIRNILDSSKQNMVPLTKDLETLQLYIDLELFRNENKFTAEIRADELLLQDDYKVPPLIVQPYVENAILHGLRNRIDNNGKLSVSVDRINGHILYIIEDNGIGRQAAANGKANDKQSYGMQMSKDRLKLFNNEDRASVTITDLHDPAGTKVEILLKMQ